MSTSTTTAAAASTLDELACISNRMNVLVDRMQKIAKTTMLNFASDDIDDIVSEWEALATRRDDLVAAITRSDTVKNKDEYIQLMHALARANDERGEIIDRFIRTASLKFQLNEDMYKTKIRMLEKRLDAVSSVESKYDHLLNKYQQLYNEYDNVINTCKC